MQECGQPPADLVGEMVSYMYPVTHFEMEIIFNLSPSNEPSPPPLLWTSTETTKDV